MIRESGEVEAIRAFREFRQEIFVLFLLLCVPTVLGARAKKSLGQDGPLDSDDDRITLFQQPFTAPNRQVLRFAAEDDLAAGRLGKILPDWRCPRFRLQCRSRLRQAVRKGRGVHFFDFLVERAKGGESVDRASRRKT